MLVTLRETQKKLAARVRALRAERGLRQDELESHGLSWKAVQKLEYGQTDPKLSTLLKLAVAFDMALKDLLDFGS